MANVQFDHAVDSHIACPFRLTTTTMYLNTCISTPICTQKSVRLNDLWRITTLLSSQESFNFLFVFILFIIKRMHDLKQWLLPKVKAAFENQKRKYHEWYWLPPISVDKDQMDFLQALSDYLEWCFEEPIEEQNHMLQTVHDILQQKITDSQSALRRIA